MNKVILTGHLTRNADVRYTNEAEPMAIARFTLAVNRRNRREGQQSADFINHVAFGKLAQFMEKYGEQGTKFEVAGRIQTGSYTNREGRKVYTFEVVCEEINFAESKASTEQHKQNNVDQGRTQQENDGFMQIPEGVEDELPFS